MKVAINGFGRIGRTALKAILERGNVEVVAINDLTDTETLAHLLKYDSVYRIWNHEVGFDETDLIVDKKKIHCYAEKEPVKLPWRELGVDVVLECTGHFLTTEDAEAHIRAGAKKVILSSPAKDETPTYVMGVNAEKYNGEKIISNASCTTNCIAPVMKILEDNFGIDKSLMTTIHSYTADQNLVDGPHKDLRRARAAALNIVPTSTGAAKATFKTIPSLKGKFDGLAIRVPSPVVSLSDIVAVLKKETDLKDLEKVFRTAEESDYAGILATTDEPVVSTDLIGNKNSAIVDLSLTQLIDGNLVKIIAWYDNERGYSERLVDLAELIGKKNV